MAKEFLSQNNIPYEEKNISIDDDALNESQKRNIRSVPTFLVGGETIVGFDKEKILSLVH
jgi:Glutaredoxin and related proteins